MSNRLTVRVAEVYLKQLASYVFKNTIPVEGSYTSDFYEDYNEVKKPYLMMVIASSDPIFTQELKDLIRKIVYFVEQYVFYTMPVVFGKASKPLTSLFLLTLPDGFNKKVVVPTLLTQHHLELLTYSDLSLFKTADLLEAKRMWLTLIKDNTAKIAKTKAKKILKLIDTHLCSSQEKIKLRNNEHSSPTKERVPVSLSEHISSLKKSLSEAQKQEESLGKQLDSVADKIYNIQEYLKILTQAESVVKLLEK